VKVLLAHLPILLLQRNWPLSRTRPIGDGGDDASMLPFDLMVLTKLLSHTGLKLAYSLVLEELSSLCSVEWESEDMREGRVGKDLYPESELETFSSPVA
jgi:hypothetical protein